LRRLLFLPHDDNARGGLRFPFRDRNSPPLAPVVK
jgi:hypothetical protein